MGFSDAGMRKAWQLSSTSMKHTEYKVAVLVGAQFHCQQVVSSLVDPNIHLHTYRVSLVEGPHLGVRTGLCALLFIQGQELAANGDTS